MANKLGREEVEEIIRVAREKREASRHEGVDLSGANLSRANLSNANLSGLNLGKADLSGANLSGVNLSGAGLHLANLRGAILGGANLRGTNLRGADLTGVKLNGVNLNRANLAGAHLVGAHLSGADLSWADLSRTNLRGAHLIGADLSWVDLVGASFKEAEVGWTTFAATDLSEAKGLETVRHHGPSIIGIDILFNSKGQIPEAFLRGCGVPESFITYLPSLLNQPIQYYSCFISYASKDTPFAERLHADLQQKGVRCWFAPEDLKIGERIRVGIDKSIRVHDKLLLILSEHSLASDWVEQEVETAFEQERQRKETVLFPVRLDEAVMQSEIGWAAHIKRTRNIGNFSQWQQGHEPYQQALKRLLRDLKVEND